MLYRIVVSHAYADLGCGDLEKLNAAFEANHKLVSQVVIPAYIDGFNDVRYPVEIYIMDDGR